jgi:hypothetical protein
VRRILFFLGVAVAFSPRNAAAQSKKECVDSYVAGQVARKEGRLKDARARFAECSASACPAALQRDCKPWSEQVEKDTPTLAVSVDVPGASVTVDGTPLSGSARLDPGEHVVRVEASGRKPTERRITLKAGEGQRKITIELEPLPVPAPVAPSRPVPVAPIVLGAAGLVGLGVFAGLGTVGNARKASLDARGCKPDCPTADVDAARKMYLGADIALGAGLAGIAAAGIALIVHLVTPPSPTSTTTAIFSPALGGGSFTIRF